MVARWRQLKDQNWVHNGDVTGDVDPLLMLHLFSCEEAVNVVQFLRSANSIQ